MSEFAGRVAVVTGAGSGIGRALALGLAERGARLALSDINLEDVAATALQVHARGIEVFYEQVDVANREEVEAHAAAVVERFGGVNQIYNNAGIAFSRPVLESEYADYERVFSINIWGVIHGTMSFLPHLIESGDGHVINVSSLNGFMGQPLMTHYCTSKFAVRGYTESLRIEMLEAGLPVQVTCVHPGGVKTNISTNTINYAIAEGYELSEAEIARNEAYNERFLKMDPNDAARIILDGVRRNKARVLVGNDARMLDVMTRQLPGRYQGLVASAARRMGIGSE
ncbi:MAG: SDR family NAD(P)-dependent oxidoreductase [Candidatus Nanopelagicales bacterium]